MTSSPHRKRVKHFHEPGDFHELTFSCYHRMPLLANNTWRAYLSQSIEEAVHCHSFRLAAFVYMPEHVHLLVYTLLSRPSISRLLAAIKRPCSVRVQRDLLRQQSPLLAKLTVRERPGKWAFRFWQAGPGYDRNLQTTKSILGSLDYLHLNPVRRGFCQAAVQWRWSSARFYHQDGGRQNDPLLPTIHGLPPEVFDEPP